MSEEKPQLDPIDVLIYAPIGAALTIRDMMPSVVEMLSTRGKSQVEQVKNTVNNAFVLARSMGQLRVNQTGADARKRVDQVRTAAETGLKVVQGFGTQAGSNVASAIRGTADAGPGREIAGNGGQPAPFIGTNGDSDGSESAHLAIPDYDTLSATQVAQRLSGLSPEELGDVRSYESSHRGRKTIISKIDALLES